MQTRHEFYCHYCESDFLIETLSMSTLNFCPNCGAERDYDEDDHSYDDDGWEEED